MSKSLQEVTIIVTILNEEQTITALIRSFAEQTVQPVGVVIVDGGSSDRTRVVVQDCINRYKNIRIHFATRPGNRSVGRNFAVEQSSTNLIACTDAGCVPEADWLENLLKTYEATKKPVVAGYYKGNYESLFQKAVIPYALVMPDAVDEKNFLPATRSLLFEKSVWEELGGFDESLGDNEDYAFAKLLEKREIPIAFAVDAVVTWQPRKTLGDFYNMIFRFARGDIQAKIVRPKVVLIFVRYVIATVTFLVLSLHQLSNGIIFLLVALFIYSSWAVLKNLRYVGSAWFWLPILQICSDIAVMGGSITGLQKLSFKSKQ